MNDADASEVKQSVVREGPMKYMTRNIQLTYQYVENLEHVHRVPRSGYDVREHVKESQKEKRHPFQRKQKVYSESKISTVVFCLHHREKTQNHDLNHGIIDRRRQGRQYMQHPGEARKSTFSRQQYELNLTCSQSPISRRSRIWRI